MYVFWIDIPITLIFLFILATQIIIIIELLILRRRHDRRRN